MVITGKFLTIYLFSPKILFSLLIYLSCYIFDIFLVRQSFALTIIFLGMYICVSRKNNSISRGAFALIFLFTAALFHKTAIVFAVAYFFRDKKRFLMLISVLVVATIFCMVNRNLIFSSIAESTYASGQIKEQTSKYLNYNIDSDENKVQTSSFRFIFKIIDRMVIFLYLMYYYSACNKRFIGFNYMYYSYIFGTVLSIILSNPGAIVFSRITHYFTMFQIILVPQALSVVDNKQIRLLQTTFFIVYFCIKFYLLIYGYYNLYVPFTNILY